MNILYKPFVQVSVFHDYYKSGQSLDLQVLPFSSALKYMNGHKMMQSKRQPFSLSVAMTENNKPFIKPTKNQRLVFALHLQNQRFINFTELPKKEKEEVFLFSQKNQNTKLVQSSIGLRPALFTLTYEGTNKDLNLVIKDENESKKLSPASSN